MLWLFDFACFNLQLQTMKENYLPDLNEIVQKIAMRFQQVCLRFFDLPVIKADIVKSGLRIAKNKCFQPHTQIICHLTYFLYLFTC